MKYEYIDNNIDFIKYYPKHWKIKKLRYLIKLKSGDFLKNDKLNKNAKYPVFGGNGHMNNTNNYNLEKECLIIGRVGAYCGNVNYINEKIWVTDNALICESNIYNKFLFYALNTMNLNTLANKSAQPVISSSRIKNQYFLYPLDSKEQNFISNYLDKACKKIEDTIKIKEEQIEKINKYYTSLIHEAVTKGVNKNTNLKNSNIEWIGRYPKHWQIIKIKQKYNVIPSNVDKKSYDNETPVKLCNYTDVYYNNFIRNDTDFMKATATSTELKKFQLQINDVLITKDSEDPNDIAIPALVKEIQEKLLCGYHLSIIRSKNTQASGSYLFWCLKDKAISSQLHREATGITRWAISQKNIKNSLIPLPPIQEQIEISKYLENTTLKMVNLRENISSQIQTLKDYKKSLIYECVTGKKQIYKI